MMIFTVDPKTKAAVRPTAKDVQSTWARFKGKSQ